MQTLYIIPIRFTITLKFSTSTVFYPIFTCSILWLSFFLRGYRGKTTDFALTSQHHRTIVAHFLNQGKWNDFLFQDALRNSVAYLIYREATISGQPIFCIVDDTIASHTKFSSQALHPIEAAYFHQSHLKGRQDYGHQIVSVMLSAMESL